MTQNQNKSVSEQAEYSRPVYENGPEGMPRVERMPDAVLDCVIEGSLFRYHANRYEGEDRDRLYGLMHDTANEALARVGGWPAPAVPAAAIVMQPVDERALFEKHYDQPWGSAAFELCPDGTYRGTVIQDAWRVWQARAALSAGPTQAAASGEPWMHHEMYADATQAILSLSRKELEAHFVQARADVSSLQCRASSAEQTAITASELLRDLTEASDVFLCGGVSGLRQAIDRARSYSASAAPAAEQTATTASASIDTPEFRERLYNYKRAISNGATSNAISALVAYIDSRAQAPSQDAPAALCGDDLDLLTALRAVCLNAKAVIQRWESPLWRQEVHTAEFINQLRKAVEIADGVVIDYGTPAAQAVERAAPDGLVEVANRMARWLHALSRMELNFQSWCCKCKELAVEWDAALAAAPVAPAVEPMDMSVEDLRLEVIKRGEKQVADAMQRRLARAERLGVNPAPAGTEPTQAARDVLADDAVLIQARDALNSLLWQFTGTPSTLRDSNARVQGHAAVKAIDAAMSAEIERIDRASAKGEGND